MVGGERRRPRLLGQSLPGHSRKKCLWTETAAASASGTASGNLTALTDGNGHTTHWYYDPYGQLTSKVDALGANAFSYVYDANGCLTLRTDAAGTWTAYGYDMVGNLWSINHQHSQTITFSYDALKRVTNMVDGNGITTYTYDGAGQLVSEAGPWSGVSVSNTYSSRLRQSMTVQAPGVGAWTNGYYYDSARRLTNVTSGAGSFGYQFAPGVQGVPSGVTLPNGASIADAYDSVARLLSITLKNSQLASLALHQYGYNLAGQRTSQTRLHGDYVSYTYDNAGQLKTAQGKEQGGSPSRLQEQFGYAYDGAGNLAYRTNNALLEAFGVNAANELTTSVPSGTLTVAGGTSPSATNVAVSGNASGTATRYADGTWALPGAALPNGSATYIATAQWAGGQQATGSVSVYLPPSASYSYDPNGSLLSDGNRCFAYDDENQLVSVWVTNFWRSDFAYDGRMRLRQRVEYAWSVSGWVASSTVRYVYDGNLVVQEQNQNNTPKVTYTRGNDLSGTMQGAGGIGGLLARTDNSLGASASCFADGNGNITCLTDGAEAVASYLYDPYGRILSQSGPLANANLYRFSSKEFHVNSGLVYYGYRFYDANLQRWLNRDPIDEYGGINLYAFVGSAPTSLVDAFGEGLPIPLPWWLLWPAEGFGPVGWGGAAVAGGLGIAVWGSLHPGPVPPPGLGAHYGPTGGENAPPVTVVASGPANPTGNSGDGNEGYRPKPRDTQDCMGGEDNDPFKGKGPKKVDFRTFFGLVPGFWSTPLSLKRPQRQKLCKVLRSLTV